MSRTIRYRTIAVLVLMGTVAACTPRDVALEYCRDGTRPILEVPEPHSVPWPAPSRFIENGTTIESVDRVWLHDEPSSTGHRVGVKIHRPDEGGTQRMDLCFIGGRFQTTLDPESTPWTTWHDTYAFVQENADATVVGVRLFNTGDGITFTHRANRWRVVAARADGFASYPGAYIHDDCVENDDMFEGVILDSKFDGCHVFLSSNAGRILPDPPDGTGRTVRVERTLVRLQAYEQSFDPARYGTNRHGGFFKFSGQPEWGTPPQLVVRSSTFRSDEPALYGGNANGHLGLPPGSICEDVMLVGADTWPEPDLRSWIDQCDGLTFGTVADWNRQVLEWDAEHPDL
jgi:hypothetical protein